MNSLLTHSEDETIQLGKRFAPGLKPGDVVACYGDLGSGKTRFIKGICSGLGVREHVTSPTFTIMNIYRANSLTICHFDLYRINSSHELLDLGFEEYTTNGNICLIEWAEKAGDLLPPERYDLQFQLGGAETERELTIVHHSGVTVA